MTSGEQLSEVSPLVIIQPKQKHPKKTLYHIPTIFKYRSHILKKFKIEKALTLNLVSTKWVSENIMTNLPCYKTLCES